MESPKNLVPRFFNETASTYDKVAFWATFGRDRYWKREIVNQISDGNSFLDLACGTGILTRDIAKKFPHSKIIGVDVTQSYLEIAKKNSASFKNISFVNQDAEKLNLDRKFDCITSSYIPKYCNPDLLVSKCVDHLNNNGKIIFHDFVYPKNVIVRGLWNFYFVLLNFVCHFFIPSWKKAFSELPALIRSSSWFADYKNAMIKNSLKVSYQYLTWNSSAILVGKKIS